MDSFVGSIFSFGFNFAPYGWAQCNGQLMPISQNEALFALIGTTYGGDGVTTFALPNLQGRVAIGTGTGPALPTYVLGEFGGAETVTLTQANLPPHNHAVLTPPSVPASNTNFESNDPTVHYFGKVSLPGAGSVYSTTSTAGVTTASTSSNSGVAGSSIPFSILNPYLVINYCISLYGIFPSRN